MSFDSKYMPVYLQSIKPACEERNYKCVRVDEEHGPKNIINQIIDFIIKSDIVIADISENSPNVFYELGVSHSVGNKTIMIMAETGNNIPFDIAPFQIIKYKDNNDGRELLRYKITESIKKLEGDKKDEIEYKKEIAPNNPVQEAGKEYFNLRKNIEEKLKALNKEITKSNKFNEFIECNFPEIDNTKTAKIIVNHIKQKVHPKKSLIISICGSGAIGKSGFAKIIKECTEKEEELGLTVSILSTDSYMLSRAERIHKNLIGFDRHANDLNKLFKDVERLVDKKKQIFVPPYYHQRGEHGEPQPVKPCDVLIIEGIYSFIPEIKNFPQVSDHLKYFIYAEKIKAKELKFISDVKERGHNIHSALQHAVPEYSAYETHVLPFIRQADYIIKVEGFWEYSMPFSQNIFFSD